MIMSSGLYRLFGELYLPSPENILSEPSLRRLRQIEPFLRDLEARISLPEGSTDWSYQNAFQAAVQDEIACWGQMGVSRLPNFALPPEGPLHASVACHLHCPSFSVKDPHSQTSGDVSNVSICQIMLAGFTTDHCLIYDHLFRREAMDGLKYYPPEILQIHEKFVYGLRDHMRAVVDICWGKCVRDRMLRTHCPECLQLWGDYQEVSIWLEWEKAANPRLKRFIIFVMHPEAMLYASRMSQGRLQDLHLTAAARIGKIKIDEHFYEYSHRPNTYGRLYRVEWDRQKSLNAQAIAEVRYAVEWRRTNGMNEVKTSIAPLIQNVTFFDFPSTKQDDSSDQSESDNAAENGSSEAYEAVNQASEVILIDGVKIDPEVMQSIKGPQGIQCLVSALIAENFTIADAVNMLNVSNELDTFAELTWEDIPYRLRSWLETQDGLKINGCSISSIPDILKCHRLLCRKSSSMKDLEDCSIIDIILQVAIRYFKQINTVHIASRITSFIVKGSRPVPRKCGSCKSQILDDAFPRFKKLEPSRYVVRFLKGGCGLDNCTPKGDNVWAVPLNNDMIWTTPDANGLRQPPQRAKWADILIRTGTDILDLPKPVSCICRRCRNADCTFIDSQPRWTIETKPRYVPRKPRCSNCGKSARWRPIETSVDWIDSALLSKLWAKFTERNWCVDELLRKPDRFFPRRKKV